MGGGRFRECCIPGRFDFLLRCSAYVRLLVAADEKHGSGQAVVASLNHYVQNEDDKMPPAGRYNAGKNCCSGAFFTPRSYCC